MKDNYRIDVKDFGPIAKASVDFRPLTVFIGQSNTGKSYLAILIYALHKCLSSSDASPSLAGIRAGFPSTLAFSRSGSSELIKSLKEWAEGVSSDDPPSELPKDVAKELRSVMEKTDWLSESITTEIRRCFGVDGIDELIRRTSHGRRGKVSLCVPQEDGSSTLRYELKFNSRTIRLSADIPSLESLPYKIDFPKRFPKHLRRSNPIYRFELSQFLSRSFQFLIGPAGRSAFYLPADRTGVMHSHQVVVSALVQNASTAGLQPSTNLPMLSGVLADFLTLLIGIGPEGRSGRRLGPRRKSPELARGLEDSLLNGSVLLKSSDAGYPTFAYRPEGWKDDMPLMRASSMVSELAPVVLYLRHIVRPGDVLIIEEPEAHLHPAMQTAFARELARLVRAGVRIVMTTHSEWFLEQIGNLVRLSGLPKAKRRDLESADYALDPDQVGAWLFKPSNRPKGSVVEEVALDPETGLYPTGYDAVSEALYNESADIYNRIQESKQK